MVVEDRNHRERTAIEARVLNDAHNSNEFFWQDEDEPLEDEIMPYGIFSFSGGLPIHRGFIFTPFHDFNRAFLDFEMPFYNRSHAWIWGPNHLIGYAASLDLMNQYWTDEEVRSEIELTKNDLSPRLKRQLAAFSSDSPQGMWRSQVDQPLLQLLQVKCEAQLRRKVGRKRKNRIIMDYFHHEHFDLEIEQ